MNTKSDFEVLEKKTFCDLKEIASHLGIAPTRGDGDARKKRTWELAIATQSKALGFSIKEACNPILRTLNLGKRNKADWAIIEQTLELIEPYLYPSICAYKTSPELLRNSPAANLAAKVLPGVAFFQDLLVEIPPVSKVDRVSEAIAPAVETSHCFGDRKATVNGGAREAGRYDWILVKCGDETTERPPRRGGSRD